MTVLWQSPDLSETGLTTGEAYNRKLQVFTPKYTDFYLSDNADKGYVWFGKGQYWSFRDKSSIESMEQKDNLVHIGTQAVYPAGLVHSGFYQMPIIGAMFALVFVGVMKWLKLKSNVEVETANL